MILQQNRGTESISQSDCHLHDKVTLSEDRE